ncbi:PEP-CTERM sorting domain-containing protein [Roseateles amylovorans]|uniref:PEP-CTERM sorting domain-containing protein n=1 Tax=Roseateles amylovorans TaxID=2978473 RepID=A0ABY6B769_9BURK|nr:PEP-CTERM sorting domain-containing protein [Roseateles amylovorans]UXH80183.1 PEP-CTERM sorting domain-containing protein [Roseateles amylovorans]
MQTFPMSRIPLVAALGAAALMALAPAPARAEYYQYNYTGNAFTMTTVNYFSEPGDPSGGRSFSLVSIDAQIIANAPLSGTVTLSDIRSFSLTLTDHDSGSRSTLDFPAPPPIECPGCPNGPNVTATFSMADFNFLNQPTGWDMSIRTSTFYPTGREGWLMLSTSWQRDMLDGGYEAYVGQSGGLINSPGIWSVTALVPEPATYVLTLAGLALLGGLTRKHWRSHGGAGVA